MTNDLRALHVNKYLRPASFVLLGALYSFQVAAKGNLDHITTATGGQVTFNPAQAPQNTKIAFGSQGQPYLTSSKSVQIPGAKNPITLAIKQPLTKAASAKAITSLLRLSTPVGAAVTAFNLMSMLADMDIAGPVMKQTPQGNAFLEYKEIDLDGSVRFANECFSCSQYFNRFWSGREYYGAPYISWLDGNSCMIGYITNGRWGEPIGQRIQSDYINSNPSCPPGANEITKTLSMSELEQKIASESGWPSSPRTVDGKTINPPTADSPLGKALTQALSSPAVEFDKPQELPQITGPSTVPGQTTTTTTTTPEGQTITTTTTNNYNITYQGDKYTINETKQTQVNDGEKVTTTTTEQEKTDIPAEKEPEPDICEKNPDALMCQKFELDTPSEDIPKTTKTITYEEQSLGFGGGSCPANAVTNIRGAGSVTVFDWQRTCGYVTTYVRPMFIALATFAALMIVFVGGTNKDSI